MLITVLSALGALILTPLALWYWRRPVKPAKRPGPPLFVNAHPTLPPAGLLLFGVGCLYAFLDRLGAVDAAPALEPIFGFALLPLVALTLLGILFSFGVPAPMFLVPPEARAGVARRREARKQRRRRRRDDG